MGGYRNRVVDSVDFEPYFHREIILRNEDVFGQKYRDDRVHVSREANFNIHLKIQKGSVNKRKARKGRNPRTGETIKIKAKKVPKFVPGKALRDAVFRFKNG